ncbi:MAG: hypothetical protein LBV58_02395 [Acholeplasmatales bacterium]|jgi:hypothetical protein|nr:hypothetical protein [Acholeplasmatales bacterium]
MEPTDILLIVVIIAAIFLLIYFLFRNSFSTISLKEYIRKNSDLGFKLEGKDYFIEIKDTKYKIIFFIGGSNYEVTLNSYTVWEIREGQRISLRYLDKMLKDEYLKIVVVVGSNSKIKRYINENEIEFVERNQLINNTYFCLIDELKLLVDELKNEEI